MSKINLQELIILVYLYYSDIEIFKKVKKPFQLYIKSVALIIEEARLLFEYHFISADMIVKPPTKYFLALSCPYLQYEQD
jgi:hypothetical protein